MIIYDPIQMKGICMEVNWAPVRLSSLMSAVSSIVVICANCWS